MNDDQRESLERAIHDRHQAGALDAAATEAIRGYGPELLGYLVAVVRDDELASEIFAVACEDIWRGLPDFAWKSSFRTWAYTLTRHACSRALRAPSHQRERRLATSDAHALAEEVRSRTVPHMRTEVKSEVARLRESLPADDQTLLILRIDRGMSWREIAVVMGNSEVGDQTVEVGQRAAMLRKRFERVKERLRRLALEAGLIEPKDD